MHIHHTAHQRFFTVIGNEALRDSRLSHMARGLLCHLLSHPDGHHADIKTIADRGREGRTRVASAMHELEHCGYVHRTVHRGAGGRLTTRVDVYDTPQPAGAPVTPSPMNPDPGAPTPASRGDNPVKDGEEKPSLPRQASAVPNPGRHQRTNTTGRAGLDPEAAQCAALMARVARADPRLVLGCGEAAALAPLVAEWRRRGASDLHIIGTLTTGLPAVVHCPAALLADRLNRKMPPERGETRPQTECEQCKVPIPTAGRCRACRGRSPDQARRQVDFGPVRARGVALARAALRGGPMVAAVPT